jgi:hypothetical protein
MLSFSMFFLKKNVENKNVINNVLYIIIDITCLLYIIFNITCYNDF